ncbi:hypothetical protein SEA_GOIB_51 [Gordonia phage Goib]|uniref:Uncharacterized protein n=2 Tax=Vendettavirus vendetta TaxID=2049886 RepID=A0A166Y466_9CAUD|nr:hypothetical protein BH795_gp61 [Gordonia phage Vendetta]YP_009275404.1 hypothetical protein BH760_gp61 [Gordonia phage Splinter]ANA85597.1 hypothetical protein PBI_VENDETTA_50 [Gordonia phage Vendetta]ANA85676.1 hypothetical protein PBI_SPLINTER_50 [Gordonia phage Splinter]WNO25793.1 hypothetical protein SEA_GOIB_51 [Gordonia phage Goib]
MKAWTVPTDDVKAIADRAKAGTASAGDTLRLVGRVQQLEAIAAALTVERDSAAAAAKTNADVLAKMREVRESGAPEPTQLAGFRYWLGEAGYHRAVGDVVEEAVKVLAAEFLGKDARDLGWPNVHDFSRNVATIFQRHGLLRGGA